MNIQNVDWVDWKDLPDISTPLSAENLNKLVPEINTILSKIQNAIFPVGSIYMSVSPDNPSTYYDGEWELITEGTFLVSASKNIENKYYVEKTGGEAEHTLTLDEMPTHAHQQYVTANAGTGDNQRGAYSGDEGGYSAYPQCMTGGQGRSQPHNNLPPYLAVYMWKRIA